MAAEKELVLRIEPKPEATVYLSVSWQPDQGKDFGYRLVRRLDETGCLVVGDAKDFKEMESPRLQRIMSKADGFLSVLPYRPDKASKTSGFMIDELRLAIGLGLPLAVIYDARIAVQATTDSTTKLSRLIFPDASAIDIESKNLIFCKGFDFGVPTSENLTLVELDAFFSQIKSRPKVGPYSFLITRLQPDFALPRAACTAAAENASGTPCIWIDSKNYSTNIDDTTERVRLLIKHAEFVVAEISLTEDNPDFDNPSRAHEIGIAMAYGKKLFLVSHEPRRHPYHGVVPRQLVWWNNEAELYEDLKTAIYAERGEIGRYVYNEEIQKVDSGHTSKFSAKKFDINQSPAWVPPASMDTAQSWIYAVSLGVIVFCLSAILRHWVGYSDTLDLVAMIAGITAFIFSSKVGNAVHSSLRRLTFLRWFVPLVALVLLVTVLVLLSRSLKG